MGPSPASMVNRKRRRPTANDPVLPVPPPPTTELDAGGTLSNSGDRTSLPDNRNELLSVLTQSQARPARPNAYTNAGVTGVLYAELVSWAIREVAVRYRHRTSVTRARAKLIAPITMDPTYNTNTNNSSGLQLHYQDKAINATCTNCASTVSASRYAQHLEKCLGRGGRMSSRAASARLKASAEREEREDDEDTGNTPAAGTVSHGRRRRAATADSDLRTGNTKRHRRSSPAPTPAARNIPTRNR